MFFYIHKYVRVHKAMLLPTSMNPVNCSFARSVLALPSPLQNPL